MIQRRLEAVDLFAGAGGFSLGLERAGIQVVLANEFSADAEWTYRHNLLSEASGDLLPTTEDAASVATYRAYVRRGRDRLHGARLNGQAASVVDGMRGGDIREAVSSAWISRWLRQRQRAPDLVVGGPPCQGFSTAGLTRLTDERNGLVSEFVRVVEAIQPRVFVLENVPGMFNRYEQSVRSVALALSASTRTFPGYVVQVELLDAAEYGVPQTRKRLFIVGVRRDLLNKKAWRRVHSRIFPVSCPLERRVASCRTRAPSAAPGQMIFSSIALQGLSRSPPFFQDRQLMPSSHYQPGRMGASDFAREMRLSRDCYLAGRNPARQKHGWNQSYLNHERSRHNERVKKRFRLLRSAANREPKLRCSRSIHERVYALDKSLQTKKDAQRVLVWNQWPGLTVTSLPDDIVHFRTSRIPTVRELARLQTFPDWFSFCGVRTTGTQNRRRAVFVPQYTQVANAVPPRLAFAVATRISQFLARLQGDRSCAFEMPGGEFTRTHSGSVSTRLDTLNSILLSS